MFRILFLLFSVLIIQGCGVRSPIARFNGAMVTQSTPEAIALTAQFEIANTNDEPLQLKFYNYTVTSGGRTVYRGMASAEQSVPRWSAMQSSILEVFMSPSQTLYSEQLSMLKWILSWGLLI